jgi:hypothetical protein
LIKLDKILKEVYIIINTYKTKFNRKWNSISKKLININKLFKKTNIWVTNQLIYNYKKLNNNKYNKMEINLISHSVNKVKHNYN